MILMLNEHIFRILTIFSLSPGSRLNRKLLKEKTGINNISLDKALSILLNLKTIKKEKRLLSLNLENEKTKIITKEISEDYANLKHLPIKEYFTICNITRELIKAKNTGEIYLFGSYAKLIFTEKSDIDIAIISDKVNKKEIGKIINSLEKKHKKAIETHFFSKKFYSNKKDPLVKEIFQHGVRLV